MIFYRKVSDNCSERLFCCFIYHSSFPPFSRTPFTTVTSVSCLVTSHHSSTGSTNLAGVKFYVYQYPCPQKNRNDESRRNYFTADHTEIKILRVRNTVLIFLQKGKLTFSNVRKNDVLCSLTLDIVRLLICMVSIMILHGTVIYQVAFLKPSSWSPLCLRHGITYSTRKMECCSCSINSHFVFGLLKVSVDGTID